jgi:hypothetical protein
MIFYRRTETLALDVRALDGETRIVALGHASKRTREVIAVTLSSLSAQAQ